MATSEVAMLKADPDFRCNVSAGSLECTPIIVSSNPVSKRTINPCMRVRVQIIPIRGKPYDVQVLHERTGASFRFKMLLAIGDGTLMPVAPNCTYAPLVGCRGGDDIWGGCD